MEDCQLSLTTVQHQALLSKRQKIEETFMVRINSPGFERLVSTDAPNERSNVPESPNNDIFIIAIEGEESSVKSAQKYITALVSPQLIHLFSYKKKLEIIFGSSFWNEILEVMYCVSISKGGDLELIISGCEIDVALTVSQMQDLVEQCSLWDKTESKEEKRHATEQLSDALKRYKNIDIHPHLYNKLPSAVIAILLKWIKQVFEVDLPEGDSCIILEDVDASVIIIDSDDESKTNSQSKSCKRSIVGNGHASHEEIEVVREVKKRKSPPPAFDFIPLNSNYENTQQIFQCNPPCIPDNKITAASHLPKINSVPKGPRLLRPVVIDGSNVAREHGKPKKVFSCRGIAISIEYFLERGHRSVTAFVPQYRRHNSFGVQATDQGILEMLAEKQLVVFTPSRKVGKKRISSYDDRFIVDLAYRNGGVIVSNDNFRDLMEENQEWKTTIEDRLLMYCFVGDIFMIPQDPLGKNGPRLDDFLSFTKT